MQPRVFLFDIDGTLLDTGGAGRRAMEQAFSGVVGRDDAFAHIGFSGMTDRAIVRAGLEAVGRGHDDALVDRVLDAYLRLLDEGLSTERRARVYRGVLLALDACARRSKAAVGLGTGNVRVGALRKLRSVGLEGRFAFGGFGCDHEHRGELLRIGASRGAALLNTSPTSCSVVVIGDTPKDVAAARHIGARCVAVATGKFSRDALAACEPDIACSSLEDPGVIDFLTAES